MYLKNVTLKYVKTKKLKQLEGEIYKFIRMRGFNALLLETDVQSYESNINTYLTELNNIFNN